MDTTPSHLTVAEREALCAKVARLVMGWESAEIPWAYDAVTPLWHTEDGEPIMTVFSWRPDRSDTQSMQVLDRMIELGFELVLTVRGDRAVVQFTLDSERVAHSDGSDRRVALLRAALDAVNSPANPERAGGDTVR